VCEHASLNSNPADHCQLESWLGAIQQLASVMAELGIEAALQHPLPAGVAWPAELQGWLADANNAAKLELAAAASQAFDTVADQLGALLAAKQVVTIPLQQQGGSAGERQGGIAQAGTAADMDSAEAKEGEKGALNESVARLLACFSDWQAMQHDLVSLVEGAAQWMADGVRHSNAQRQQQQQQQCEGSKGKLDLSMQSLTGLDVLAGRSAVTSLNLNRNAITR
jgi:hypothetical protein